MKQLEFPLLTKDDIEVRIGQLSKDGKKASLLLYQDARCAMKYLDKVVGPYNWQKKYYEVRGLVICSIGIYNEDTKEWLWKDDTGSSGTIEEEKSIISDSTKRAAVAWGLARELYTSPQIWVDINDKYDRFSVKEIGYNEHREIVKLVIINDKTKSEVFSYGNSSTKIQHEEKPQVDTQTVLKDRTELYSIVLKKYGEDVGTFNSWLSRKYGAGSLKELPDGKVGEVLAIMRKVKQ